MYDTVHRSLINRYDRKNKKVRILELALDGKLIEFSCGGSLQK